jgi:hypothetical protein
MTEQPRLKEPDDGMRRLAVITVATSLLVWWPAFTLGVYDTIFFEQLFALWAAATAAFLVAVRLLPSAPVGLDRVDVADPRRPHQP